jgi:hypothetical protein
MVGRLQEGLHYQVVVQGTHEGRSLPLTSSPGGKTMQTCRGRNKLRPHMFPKSSTATAEVAPR